MWRGSGSAITALPHRVRRLSPWTRVRAAVFQAASLSTARLAALLDDRTTGLTPFLAHGTQPSSGLMIVEYTAHSGARRYPQARHAGGARRRGAVHRRGGACGLRDAGGVVGDRRGAGLPGRPGVRACQRRPGIAAAPAAATDGQLRQAFDRAEAVLPGALTDRPLDEDLTAAGELLAALGDLFAGSAGPQANPVGSAR